MICFHGKMDYLTCLFLILGYAVKGTVSAKILASIFVPSFSHQLPFRPIWKELAKKGHEITLLTTDPMRDSTLKNIREIDLSGSYEILQKMNTFSLIAKEKTTSLAFFNDIRKHFDAVDSVIEWQLTQPEVKTLIQNGSGYFDVLIVEIMHPIHMAFADR